VVRKRFCKHCKVSIAGRSNKIFCSANCRKRSSEGNKNSFVSYEKKNHNMRLFDSATRIAEMYFQMSPFERLGLMREYIILARQGNGKMREVLSNEDVLKLLREIDVHLHDGSDVMSAYRKAGISDKSYYYWCKKFGGIGRSLTKGCT